MADSLTSDRPRNNELIDVQKKVAAHGAICGDVSPNFNTRRQQSSAHKGLLRQLIELLKVHRAFDELRKHYSLGFTLCDRAPRGGFHSRPSQTDSILH